MLPKLLAIVLASGVIAAGLLVFRHRRIETASEMTRLHEQVLDHERAAWELRVALARSAGPQRARALLAGLDVAWEPVVPPAPLDLRVPEARLDD